MLIHLTPKHTMGCGWLAAASRFVETAGATRARISETRGARWRPGPARPGPLRRAWEARPWRCCGCERRRYHSLWCGGVKWISIRGSYVRSLTVPRVWCVGIFVLFVPGGGMAQSTTLADCGASSAVCADVLLTETIDPSCDDGPRLLRSFAGRVAWRALKYEGPIIIKVNAKKMVGTRFPIFIEVLPLGENTGGALCDGSGRVVMLAEGTGSCDEWETAGPVDLSSWVSVGDN